MLNSTLKIVRSRIVESYRDRIDSLYTPLGRNPYSPENLRVVSTLLARD